MSKIELAKKTDCLSFKFYFFTNLQILYNIYRNFTILRLGKQNTWILGTVYGIFF